MATLAERELSAQIKQTEKEITKARKRLLSLRKKIKPTQITDYTLYMPNGEPMLLSSLFGNQSELMVIHNMGKACVYCTLWADGFNGVVQHLKDRSPFVVVTPDRPSVMREFSQSRGWTFPMLSSHESGFSKDMGFISAKGQPQPGVMTFSRNSKGQIFRHTTDMFGPGDPYCAVWHLFDLLPKGTNDWAPQYSYPKPVQLQRLVKA